VEKQVKYEKQERINQSLIHSAQAGDVQALNKLLSNNTPLIKSWFLTNKTVPPYMVDDFVQDVLIKTSINLHRYNFECRLTSFIYNIYKNILFDWLRGEKLLTDELFEFSESILIDDSETEYIQTETLTERKNELKRRIENLKNQEMKKVMLMHIYQDLSYKEIVEQTGLTESNVKTLISRGKDKVKNNFC